MFTVSGVCAEGFARSILEKLKLVAHTSPTPPFRDKTARVVLPSPPLKQTITHTLATLSRFAHSTRSRPLHGERNTGEY
jgi:hypothetical protein